MHKKPLTLSAVSSSNLASVGYDPDTKTLAVQFKSGAVGHYSGVSAKEHAALIAAPSVGGYFAAHIRPHKHHTNATDLYPKS